MHIDFDYFFAQVEERENPQIKHKPVVVCVYSGRSGDSGAVSTANYIARKYGVKSGMPIAFAKKRLKDVDAVFLPVNHNLYDAVSERIMNIIRKYADKFEQVGVDEAFLEVTQRVNGNFEKASKLAFEIKTEIFSKEKTTCSIGIGPNKLVAKIAAGRQKPNGVTAVRPEKMQQFLSPLPVREIVGVGRKTETAMQKAGIKTIGELAAFNVSKLIDMFGKSLGIYFHNAALGIDTSPVEQKNRVDSISRIITLKEDTRDINLLAEEIGKLVEDVISSSVEQGFSFKTVSITAVMDDLTFNSRSKTFQNPTRSSKIAKETAIDLLIQLFKEETEHLIRRIGVKISNLVERKGQKQLTEF